MLPEKDHQKASEQLACANGHIGASGAAEDSGVVDLRISCNGLTGDEGAHAVTEKEEGQVGVFVLHVQGEGVNVLHQEIGASARCGEAQLLLGGSSAAVTQMVVAKHQNAPPCHKGGKGGVALEVLTHAVRDLQKRLGIFAFGAVAGKGGLAVGRG